MAQTQRFGLSHFGLGVDGSFTENGGKHTGRDRRVIDRILAAFEGHRHEGGQRLLDPEDPPTLTLDTTQGALRAGTTYYYRTSFIDQYGLETAASGETAVATFAPVSEPGPPSLNAISGGSLDDGLYYYAFTGWSEGNETILSTPQAISISDWKTVEVFVASTLSAGTDQVSVWRQGPLESGFTRLVTVPIGEDDHPEEPGDALHPLFVDDGSIPSDPCPCDPLQQPPTQNLTNATNAVEVEVPPLPERAFRWRIYRTRQSGVYNAASLVAEVVETDEPEGGALVTTYLDLGEPLSPGQPLEASQTLTPSRLMGDGAAGGSGRIFLTAPDLSIWILMATLDGSLETRPLGITSDVALPTPVLEDTGGNLWRVVWGAGGVLTTEDANAEAGSSSDLRFEPNQGPFIHTSDPAVVWRLNVSVGGVLITEGEAVPGARLAYMLPVSVEPAAPASGGVLYFHEGELRFKTSADVVTVLA